MGSALPDSLQVLLKPIPRRAVKGVAFWIAFVLTAMFAVLCKFIAADSRSDLARAAVGYTGPVAIGALAIVLATMAIFATLADQRFKKLMPEWRMIAGSFMWMTICIVLSVVVDIILLLCTYSPPVVKSNWFVGAGWFGFFLFVYGILLNIQAAHTALRMMIAEEMISRSHPENSWDRSA